MAITGLSSQNSAMGARRGLHPDQLRVLVRLRGVALKHPRMEACANAPPAHDAA